MLNLLVDTILDMFFTIKGLIFSIIFFTVSMVYVFACIWSGTAIVLPAQKNIDIVGLPNWLAPDMLELNRLAKEKPNSFSGVPARYR